MRGKRELITLVSMLAVGIPQGARADGHQLAERLLADCSAKTSDSGFQVKRAACDGYLAGAYDLLFDRKTAAEKSCAPRTVTRERLRSMILDYLRRHPEDLSYSAATAVRTAASEAWPHCSFG